MSSMNPLISKARKPKFELTFRIIDLNNVPLVSGTSSVKWHLPASSTADHHGRTERASVKEHKVIWDYTKTVPVRLIINKNNALEDTPLTFEVVQEYSSGSKAERNTLGQVVLNLAEYVEESEVADEEGVVRRYLMQDSKINSTLKIGVLIKQVEGERNYSAPPLRSAPVFQGIAGIMSGEIEENVETGSTAKLQKGHDHNDLQDIYRRALAASWGAQPGELPADECIEDLFAGGDGWKKGSAPTPKVADDETSHVEDHRGLLHAHRRNDSSSSLNSKHTVKAGSRMGHRHTRSREIGHAPGIQTPVEQVTSRSNQPERNSGYRKAYEVDEFEVRDDLIAWHLPGKLTV